MRKNSKNREHCKIKNVHNFAQCAFAANLDGVHRASAW
jgi:hypothetical protein